MTRIRIHWLAVVLLAFSVVMPAHARFVQPPPCKNSFTPDREIVEGKKAEAQVYKQMPILPDSSPVTLYIQQLGAKLVQAAPASPWHYSFHVINQADINAFALPGGPIFVNLGTIQAAETEAQLAGVMAHEISHVVMCHATCNITKQQSQAPWWALGQLAAGVLLPGAGGALAAEGVGAAAGMTFLKMGRDAEKQADLMGTDIAYDAGYDPRGMVQFFEIIQGKYGNGGSQFLSDHPNPGNRSEYVNAEIATLPPRPQWLKTTPEFQKIHKLAMGMHAYSAKEISSGTWRGKSGSVPPPIDVQPNDFQPNGQWTLLDGSGFTVQYPANWQAVEKADAGTTIAPPNGVATSASDSNTVIYGVIIDDFQPQQGADLGTATQQLIVSIQQGNTRLKETTSVDQIRVNQRDARSVEFLNQGESAGGASERDWLVAVARDDGSLSYLVFVAPQKNFEMLRPTFEQMLRTFKVKS
ncbi:M48 family metallopeptidase [Alloacidobacterium sp.]|uniref:M48 family metallopeptidase n=1 Tax=Alloacidobacterium sp. TaxID=2951999 RepID=UPI002D74FB5E|nr:M48 family metalloprotease [Alloacidobacterium sp.]HYK37510.1 M48 family metalloprotease [Alloacidobacterium sp.]